MTKKREHTMILASHKKGLFYKAVSCLLILCFSLHSLAYGFDSDTFDRIRARESGKMSEIVRQAIAPGANNTQPLSQLRQPEIVTIDKSGSNYSSNYTVETATSTSQESRSRGKTGLEVTASAGNSETADIERKAQRVRELFGERVIAEDIDLDYGFQQFVEGHRSARITDCVKSVKRYIGWVPGSITLIPFVRCTAQCGFCAVSGSPFNQHVMSPQVMDRAMDIPEYLKLDSGIGRGIHLSGGEVFTIPIDELIALIEKYHITSLATNASMMNRRNAAKFAKELNRVMISRRNRAAWRWDKVKRFDIDISLDDWHLEQRSISIEKIANLIEAIWLHCPEAQIGLITLKGLWKENAFPALCAELKARGLHRSDNTSGEGVYRFNTISSHRPLEIYVQENPVFRIGEAIYETRDEYFKRGDFPVARSGLSAMVEPVTIAPNGDVSFFEFEISGHTPLVFGSIAKQTWEEISEYLEKDPLSRALVFCPNELIEVAEEYDPGIVEEIQNGRPGHAMAIIHWLMSNPERKLYATYMFLNKGFKSGTLSGENPYQDMTNNELKRTVIKELSELRTRYKSDSSDEHGAARVSWDGPESAVSTST
ncbi:MAG: radical SAM protein, partial [Candidatus Omnitrophota bacterium]